MTNGQRGGINYRLDTIISPRVVNQFRLLLGHYYQPTTSLTAGPRIAVQDAFVGGGARPDQLRTEYHFTSALVQPNSAFGQSDKYGYNEGHDDKHSSASHVVGLGFFRPDHRTRLCRGPRADPAPRDSEAPDH